MRVGVYSNITPKLGTNKSQVDLMAERHHKEAVHWAVVGAFLDYLNRDLDHAYKVVSRPAEGFDFLCIDEFTGHHTAVEILGIPIPANMTTINGVCRTFALNVFERLKGLGEGKLKGRFVLGPDDPLKLAELPKHQRGPLLDRLSERLSKLLPQLKPGPATDVDISNFVFTVAKLWEQDTFDLTPGHSLSGPSATEGELTDFLYEHVSRKNEQQLKPPHQKGMETFLLIHSSGKPHSHAIFRSLDRLPKTSYSYIQHFFVAREDGGWEFSEWTTR